MTDVVAAPAAPAAPAVPATVPVPGAVTPPPVPAPAPWHAADEDTAAYVKVKGWTDANSAIKSYREAEKLIGRDPNTLLVLPRADDAAGKMAMYDKLGRPAEANGYDMTGGIAGAQLDPAFAPAAAKMFHDAGLSTEQGKNMAKAYNEHVAQAAAQAETDYDNNVKADRATLQAEWRGGFERKMGAAQAAVQALGFTVEAIDGIEHALGYAGTVKLFAKIGAKIGEDKFVGADGKTPRFGEAYTPAEAKVAWDQKKLDPNFTAALTDRGHPGHAAAKAEQTKMFAIIYPEGM